MVSMKILYKWPTRLGGWLVGQIAEPNTNMGTKLHGEFCHNFKVAYMYEGEDELARHLLSIENYATAASSTVDSWGCCLANSC